jgi:hypothetical protein
MSLQDAVASIGLRGLIVAELQIAIRTVAFAVVGYGGYLFISGRPLLEVASMPTAIIAVVLLALANAAFVIGAIRDSGWFWTSKQVADKYEGGGTEVEDS